MTPEPEALPTGPEPRTGSPPASPAEPLLTIEAGRRWFWPDLRDLLAHRDLFYFLVMRDVKLRYKQTALGVTWVILQPVLTMVIFSKLFGRVVGLPSNGKPYAMFVYAGLLPWGFVSAAVTSTSNSVINNSALITKVYFPRLIIPAASVGAAMVDFAIASAILFLMMMRFAIAPTASILMLGPLVVLTAAVAFGLGAWSAALNVKYRDVRYALPFLVNIWMFLTPVIYPVKFLPPHWRWLIRFNPLTGIIGGYRSAVFGEPFIWIDLGLSTLITGAMLAWAIYVFREMEREFADII